MNKNALTNNIRDILIVIVVEQSVGGFKSLQTKYPLHRVEGYRVKTPYQENTVNQAPVIDQRQSDCNAKR